MTLSCRTPLYEIKAPAPPALTLRAALAPSSGKGAGCAAGQV